MKRIFILLFLALCSSNQAHLSAITSSIYPIFDSQDHKLPRNFRMAIHESIQRPSINLLGLNYLRISGSAQFSEKTFHAMVNSILVDPNQLIVIDLREESHGFLNEVAVSWTDGNNFANRNKTKTEIISDENARLKECLQEQEMKIIDHLGKSNTMIIHNIKTEQELVENAGVTYIRLPVTDHKHPSNEIIDEFVSMINHLPSDYWIHVHCKGGRGRTTTLLCMYDIIKNAHQVSLEDILDRQCLIGGIDLTQIQKKNSERSQDAKERLEFIREFYRYCQDIPDFHMTWSEWVSNKIAYSL